MPPQKNTRVRRNSPESAPEAASEVSAPIPSRSPASPVLADEAPRKQAPAAEQHRRLDPTDLEAIASMSMDELASLMDGASSRSKVEIGQKVQGVVTRMGRDNVFVDIGAKAEAMMEAEDATDVKVGDAITAFVLDIDDAGGIQLSRKISGSMAASMLEQAKAAGVPVEGRVASRNPGGYVVQIGAVRAFCPMSQMDRHPDSDPDKYIGQTLEFHIVEIKERDVVVSRRKLLESGLEEKRQKFWADAKVGDTYQGVVANSAAFGVFVDLDGVEGLVPKRELSWDDDVAPAAFARGQKIAVRVVDLDHEKRKITLSARDPGMSPWLRVGADFVHGGVYSGKVLRNEAYGAFVELAPGLVGLLHSSRGKGKLEAGAQINVRITNIDAERHRLELSDPDGGTQTGPAGDSETGKMIKGTIKEVMKNGLVIELEDGNTGWVPSREVDLPAGTILGQRFRPGREIQARVIEVDPSRRRVTLSMKTQSEDSNWRGSATSTGSGSLGTFGDLLKGFNGKK